MRQIHSTVFARATADRDPGVIVSTLIPARLERLPWGRFHILVVAALGITWILDGLEVTLAGSVAGALEASPALHFSDPRGRPRRQRLSERRRLGALFFGWLTDRLGRKKLFFITIGVYLSATARPVSPGTASLLPVPLPHRRRHRRRIRGDQFDHPGVDPGALPRPHSIS